MKNSPFLIARVLVACELDPAEEVPGAAASPSVEDEASAVAPEPSPGALRARVDFVTSASPFLSLPPNLCDLAARVDADAAQRDRFLVESEQILREQIQEVRRTAQAEPDPWERFVLEGVTESMEARARWLRRARAWLRSEGG